MSDASSVGFMGSVKTEGLSTVGSEFTRILGLTLGFAVVNVVLLASAFQSKYPNVNQLMAFLLLFAGGTGIFLVSLPYIKNFVDTDFRRHMATGFVVVCILTLLVFGILFATKNIGIPLAKVAVNRDQNSKSLNLTLQKVPSGPTFVKQSVDYGCKFGIVDSVDLHDYIPGLLEYPEFILFSTQCITPGVNVSQNCFRVAPETATMQRVIDKMSEGTSVINVTAVDKDVDGKGNVVVVSNPKFWEKRRVLNAKKVVALGVCGEPNQNMVACGAVVLTPYTFGYNPENVVPTLEDQAFATSIRILDEVSQGVMSDLRNFSSRFNYIKTQNSIVQFDAHGDAQWAHFFEMRATDNGWLSLETVIHIDSHAQIELVHK